MIKRKGIKEIMNSPAEVANNYLTIGMGKAKIPPVKMFMLAILAGMYIAIAGVGASVAAVTIENPSLAKLVSGCIFPAGLAMVILAGSELFTGDCLMIIPCMSKKITIWEMIRSWVIVYAGNFVGGVLVSAMVVYGHTFSMFNNGMAESAVAIAAGKTALSFSDALIRGIMCNILVCVAVWMGFAAKDAAGKVLAIFFPIMVFVICGYEHSVANMYYIPSGLFAMNEYGIAAEGLSWGTFLIKNEIPVTLGNIIGGLFVGLMYWGIYLKKAVEGKNKK